MEVVSVLAPVSEHDSQLSPMALKQLLILEPVAVIAWPLDSVPNLELGEREKAYCTGLRSETRRNEWLAGRRVAKELLYRRYRLDPAGTEVLPDPSGAPQVHAQVNARRLRLSLSHTRRYAAAACGEVAVGVDLCDLADAVRLDRIQARVFEPGEAERIGALASWESRASTWAVKEACLKASGGGVFAPGARSVRILSLSPPRVANLGLEVLLFRLPAAVLALSFQARRPLAENKGVNEDVNAQDHRS